MVWKPMASLTGISVAALLSLPAAAQAGGDSAAGRQQPGVYVDSEGCEEVIVSGIRGSLERSIDLNRDPDAVVEAICEEDIGKFADAYEKGVAIFGYAGVGVINDLGIANGGLGGNQNVTVWAGGIGATVPVGDNALTFTLHGVTGDATSPAARTGVDSLGRRFVQFDGQTQFVPPGLDITGATMTSSYDEIGMHAELDPRGGLFTIFGGPVVSGRPSLGFSVIERDERLRVDYGGINFFIDERRAVDTTRLNAGLEFDIGLLDPQSSRAYVRIAARALANLDIVDGEGRYHTGQTGNFDETVIADLSRTAITFAFGAQAEAGVEIAEGVTIFATGSAGRIPIWSIVPREGEQARLKSNMHWSFGGSIGVAAGF